MCQKCGNKVVSKYNAFSSHRMTSQKLRHIWKTLARMSTKKGCLWSFVATCLHHDVSLCQLIFEVTEHANAFVEHRHEMMMGGGVRHVLGAGLLEKMKTQTMQMHMFGLSLAHIIGQYTKDVRKLTSKNGVVMRDTFVMPVDIWNIF